MNPHLPRPNGPRYDQSQAEQLVDALQMSFGRVLSTETASPFALLFSPGGKVFKIVVDDLGVLSAVSVPKGRPL